MKPITSDKVLLKAISQEYPRSSMLKIATKYHTDERRISILIDKLHLPKRKSGGYRKYTLNEECFDVDSPERNYWLGFLLADGCVHISKKKQYILKLTLAIKDRDHLEKFKLFLQTNIPIGTGISNKEYCVLAITSEKIVKKLILLGIKPRKTYTAVVPFFLKNDVNFWRGVIDGDGCVSANPPLIHLSATQSVCNDFQKFINSKIQKTFQVTRGHGRIYQTRVTWRNGQKMIKIIYDNAPIYLERKYHLAVKATQFTFKYQKNQ